jgi:N-acetylneuraminate synthase
MEIAGREIGTHLPPYVVAEIGAGHDGTEGSILELMKCAKEASADAVKIQVYKPEDLTLDSPLPEYQLESGLWRGRTLWDIYERGQIPEKLVPRLFEGARNMGITLFASAFSTRVIPMLEGLGCPAYKVASAEMNHTELLIGLRDTCKPMIISTGMGNLIEARTAHAVVQEHFDDDTAMLHCVAEYPCKPGNANLPRMQAMQRMFDPDLVGLSDHTPGNQTAVAAVALGATIIEKHIAFAGTLDAGFGLRPWEFRSFVKAVKEAWDGCFTTPAEDGASSKLRRSVRATADIAEGEILTEQNIAVLRPAGGANPRDYALMLGGKARAEIRRGQSVLLCVVEAE